MQLNTKGLCSLKLIIHIGINVLILGAIISCAQPENDQTIILKRQVISDYNEIESAVRDSFAKQHNKSHLGDVIQKFFEQRSAKKSKGGCTIAVLDPHMRFIAGRNLGTQDAEITTVDMALKNYRYLKEHFKGIEKGRMVQNILYYENNKIYVFAKAVKQGQALLGYLFIAYNEERFNKDWKINDEQFLSIDFRKTG